MARVESYWSSESLGGPKLKNNYELLQTLVARESTPSLRLPAGSTINRSRAVF